MLKGDNFESLAILRLNTASHVLHSSCSPDKDLLLVISRLGNKDLVSLWKMQGGKKWEVDVSGNGAGQGHEEVTAIAWSPDGMSILIAHHPARLSIHSIQDGQRERSVSFSPTLNPFRITNVWWIKFTSPSKEGSDLPDFFKRNKTTPGSALSQLKMQPLLDPMKDDTFPTTPSDLFSFRAALPTSNTKSQPPKLPASIAHWPVLPPDLVAASIKPYPRPGDPQQRRPGLPEEVLDDVRVEASSNHDSFLVVADNRGRCHFFLDATYSLGSVSLPSYSSTADGDGDSETGPAPSSLLSAEISSLTPVPLTPTILCHLRYHAEGKVLTTTMPSVIDLTPLRSPLIRDVAKTSSAACDLAWYMLRAMDEMRNIWIGEQQRDGSGGGGGAHSINPRWIKEIEIRQSMHAAGKPPNAICDLTSLLVSGRPTDALNDALGSLSERGISKWETSMAEALTVLRDFSEKRVVLAAQRLLIIMKEVKGWCSLSQRYGMFQFDEKLVDRVIDWLRKAIVLSTWMASTAREQLYQFKEFKSWLKYESNKVNNNGADDFRMRALSWDMLEVNRYLMDGINGSSLDHFFDKDKGGKGRMVSSASAATTAIVTPYDVRAPATPGTLEDAIKAARRTLDRPPARAWEEAPQLKDISKIDRNLERLIKEIAQVCQRIFAPAGLGLGQRVRVGVLVDHLDRPREKQKQPHPHPAKPENLNFGFGFGFEAASRHYKMRERTTIQDGVATQFVLSLGSHGGEISPQLLCLIRLRYDVHTGVGVGVGVGVGDHGIRLEVATIVCELGEEDNVNLSVRIMDFDFFDDKYVVLVFETPGASGEREPPAYVGMISYQGQDLKYNLASTALLDPQNVWRESLIHNTIIDQHETENRNPLRLVGMRKLGLRSMGQGMMMTVNGRPGRQTVCVLNGKGTEIEVVDMAEEEEEEEEEEEGERTREDSAEEDESEMKE